MRFALALVFGALPCQAFRPWTRPAWEGVAIVKQGTSAEPSPACLAAMGRSAVIGGILMKLPDTAECVVICSSHGNDPMTEQVDDRRPRPLVREGAAEPVSRHDLCLDLNKQRSDVSMDGLIVA